MQDSSRIEMKDKSQALFKSIQFSLNQEEQPIQNEAKVEKCKSNDFKQKINETESIFGNIDHWTKAFINI